MVRRELLSKSEETTTSLINYCAVSLIIVFDSSTHAALPLVAFPRVSFKGGFVRQWPHSCNGQDIVKTNNY